jgi:two-component system response regulator AtoC
VDVKHLPQEILFSQSIDVIESTVNLENMDLEANVAKLEKNLLSKAITVAGGNKAKAARLLNISERTFWYKLKKYEM